MGRAARVTTIDVIQEMAAAVDSFRAGSTAALDELAMEIRRALEWIHHDRKEYWKGEVRRQWERISEAQVALQQAMTNRRVADHQPSCVDEKKALERARQRLRLAQEKVEAVARASHAIDRAVNEYRGCCAPLNSWLDAESPKAMASLQQIMTTLEAYIAVATPHEASPVSSSASAEPPAGDPSAGKDPS